MILTIPQVANAATKWLEPLNIKNVRDFCGRSELSAGSQSLYMYMLKKFLRFAAKWDNPGQTQAQTYANLVSDYLKTYKNSRKSTFESHKRVLRAFFRWLKSMDLLECEIRFNQRWDVTKSRFLEEEIHLVKKQVKVLDHDKAVAFLKFCRMHHPREWFALHMMYWYGLRQSEVRAIQVKSFQHIEGIGLRLILVAKGRNTRFIPIKDVSLEQIRLYKELLGINMPNHYLYPRKLSNANRGALAVPIPESTMQYAPAVPVLNRAAMNDSIRLAYKAFSGEDREITSHWLRRSFCTFLKKNGHDNYDIARVMGWKSIKTVQHYDMSDALENVKIKELIESAEF